ncbi:alpha-mannosidase [Paenibacillus sacheonensis]|uniref:Alpha-mannosidase n=1 Tax=Paenibacillus sacheonensis TaxID=742054 RepID=A0A7X5C2Z0_9BACL|nr:alpha-mannosidase [Paenibacillus sacheonensis]MBM7568212.1 alpha-mannosidase [Paenibacillus sacheonensis]NBC71790.1 alpha-mannosidase [Paenibacillus sacheonensis]
MTKQASIHLIGNAHLDPVWLWQWQEGYAEIKATFRSALDRLKEYPEFVFTRSCAAYYAWIEENAPDMFEEIKARVAEGRWVIVGGWWIQPDCNLPSGESFARHGLYGQRYFQEKFGVMAKVGYNVDSFGHNGMLPQLLKKSGMDYYVFMRPEKHEKELESNLFWWESEDGSRVLTFRLSDNYSSSWGTPFADKVRKHANMADADGHAHMTFYGVGNHGGGPTIGNLEAIKELQAEYGKEAFVISTPNRYFAEIEAARPELPVLKDELQMHAVGCYSTHSESKENNRRAEHRLLTAEKFSSAATVLLGLPYPSAQLKTAWENVLFNQFHDIMGGCSIREAFQDARESYGEALHLAAKALNAATQRISWSIDTMKPEVKTLSKDKNWLSWEQGDLGTPFVVFNPLSWDVEVPVHANRKMTGVEDDRGTAVPFQTVRASRTNGQDNWDTLFLAEVPAMGYRVYWCYLSKEPAPAATLETPATAEGSVLENAFLRVEFNRHSGAVASLLDKRTNTEVLGGPGAVPVVIDEHHSDTWGHGLHSYRDLIGYFADAEVKVLENGPLRATIRVTSRYNDSVLRQEFTLHAHSAELRVNAKLDWREKHKMLKLSFPVAVERPESYSEIPYGFIRRDTDGKEMPGQQWIDVAGHAPGTENVRGLAILNNGKYAYDVLGGEARMTIVRSPIYADHYGERDDRVEYMDQGQQEFAYVLAPHQGVWQDAGIVRKAYELNVSPVGVWETYHEGSLPQQQTGIRVSSADVAATALKQAEDGDGWILRCYETAGRPAETALEVPMLNRRWSSSFGKCEIKTFHIPSDAGLPVREVNLIEFETAE